MGSFSSLFSDVSGVLDMLKPETLEKLGPFGDHVKLVGQGLTAAAALLALVFGQSSWAPPTPAMPKLPVIGTAVVVAAGLFVINSQSGMATGDVDLWRWCFALLAAGLVSLLAYFLLKSQLCFSCDYDPDTVHVAGLRLKRQARSVLRGEAAGLTGQYVLHPRADGTLDIPAGPKDYFCRTDRAPNFVWQNGRFSWPAQFWSSRSGSRSLFCRWGFTRDRPHSPSPISKSTIVPSPFRPTSCSSSIPTPSERLPPRA